MGPFEAFYASPVQHPWLLWLAAGVGLAFALTRRGLHPSLARYCIVLTALSVADAWLTSTHVYGLGTLEGAAARVVPLCFVLAGDFRFLLLLGAARENGGLRPEPRHFIEAAALTAIVPVFSQIVVSMLGESSSRVLFLVYEVGFLALTLVLMRGHPNVLALPWLRPVCRFVLLYYGLWAASDVLILATGTDLGFGLRVVPNVLYYGGLVGAMAWAGARGSGH